VSIITISRGSYSRGKDVAEKLAKKLGYECLSREILLEASQQFNIPEIKLIRAIHDAPAILERFTYGKERYVSFIRVALLRHVQHDKVVYHGLAGHFFLQGIPHVFKVRIISDLEDRVAEEMRRENISAEEARYILKKDDDERRKWSLYLYGVDTWDANLYDLVFNLKNLTVDDAVAIIEQAVKLPCCRTTPRSQELLDDLVLAARVQAALMENFPSALVTAREGKVSISVKGSLFGINEAAEKEISRIANRVVGLEVKVKIAWRP
jgi:cytidylate kinase